MNEQPRPKKVFRHPLSPYTRALLEAVPLISPQAERARRRAIADCGLRIADFGNRDSEIAESGKADSSFNPQSGCRFRPRCPYAVAECSEVTPELEEIAPNHWAACIRISRERPDIVDARPGAKSGLTASRVARGAPGGSNL